MAKAIIFTRVSTQKQDADVQEAALYRMAERDGYAESDIVSIKEKESGIKLSEEERVGLNRLKEEVGKGGVECVYVREVSRIGRTKKVVYSVVDYLIEHRIQLCIYEPSMRLLNDDGSENDMSMMVLSMYVQMSESEMKVKRVRFSQAKEKMSLNGMWNGGGKVRFGYRIAGRKYEIDPVTSATVKEIYRLYLQEGAGVSSVTAQLNGRGVDIDKRMVRRILMFEGYTGECQVERGNRRTYPIIIDRETYELAKAKREDKNTYKDKSSAHYLGAGLVVCPFCGHHYTPQRSLRVYSCIASTNKGYYHAECKGSVSININALDTILWEDAKDTYIDTLMEDSAERKAELTSRVEELRQKLSAIDKRIESSELRKATFDDQFAVGTLTAERYEALIAKIRQAAEGDRKQRAQLQAWLGDAETQLSEIDNRGDFVEDYHAARMYIAQLPRDFSYMYTLTHRMIRKVTVERSECVGERTTMVKCEHHDGTESVYHFFPLRRGKCRYARMADTVVGMTRAEADAKPYFIEDIEVIERVRPRKRKK